MSTTKEKLQALIREALENNKEDSILLKRPKIIKEEEGVLRSTHAEIEPSKEVEGMVKRAKELSPQDLARLYDAVQKMYLATKED